ncbi:sulfatase [Puteibacter caeruleilacunae]|nr:sulfatase [Puteibacter caeruleilacunae]
MNYYYSILIGLLILCFGGYAQEKPKNVIWLIAEDLSNDLGCYGNGLVHTPNLDGLAKQGVRFTHTFATGAVCTPSRTAFSTGMYQTSINAHHMRYPNSLKNELPEGVLTLNELMRRNGVQTANIRNSYGNAKTDWSYKSKGSHFDYSKWDQINPDKPFFAVVNFHLTHRKFVRTPDRPVDQNRINLPPYYPDREPVREDWAAYYESIQKLDRLIGNALADIRSRGLDENTVIVFFADHGRPMTRAKMFNYDSGLQVPMIVVGADGITDSNVYPELVSLIDLTATTLDIAGVEVPKTMQGRSFYHANGKELRKAVYSASDRIGGTNLKSRSVRTSQFRYIRNYHHDLSVNEAATAYRKANHPIYHVLKELGKRGELSPIQEALIKPMPEEELYDIVNDPYETNNLISDKKYVKIAKKLRKQLADWQKETIDYGMMKDSESIVNAFEQYRSKSAANYKQKQENLRTYVLEKL